ncbi:peptidase S41 [Aliivibrio finisterrensis]|uniref:Peptidase S41 n=1 Tax=Aliivibrio finisterrensis TaxID=511998 RepID=A0A4Q5KKT8_9GAMM|nr:MULTISPECIES: S41 family peptidase [Aliivibrio]MDD9173634.1 S41 family peptidase [Aliivibrio sp. S3TY1]MDD9190710.1 S41 family peptidase [Aliivibrio sp. S2TY2]RYU46943.1 peptidase S41 [Aliivibrio finisterrensis]
MLQRYIAVISLLFVLFPPLLLANNSNKNETLSTEDKLYGLSLLWKEVNYNFAYFNQVPELDFDAAYQATIPKILATNNTFEYYRELRRFMALLKDGHTGVYYPARESKQYFNWPAIWAIEAEGEAIVVSIDNQLQSEIPLGSKIISVDGLEFSSHLKQKVMPYISSSTKHALLENSVIAAFSSDDIMSSEIIVGFISPSGTKGKIKLVRDARWRHINYSSLNYPSPITEGNEVSFELKWLDEGVLYIALNSFHDRSIYQKFLESFHVIEKAQTLIIDIRLNGGGDGNIGAQILSHLTQRKLEGSKWETPKHIAAYKAWGRNLKDSNSNNTLETGHAPTIYPHNNAHVVPTFVLTSRYTGSAAEDFLVYVDKVKHFTIIGESTNGSTGQILTLDLPGGGKARICTKRDFYPDGREFVGVGIKPDIYIERKIDDIINERDVVLQQAIIEARKKVVNK